MEGIIRGELRGNEGWGTSGSEGSATRVVWLSRGGCVRAWEGR